MCICVCTREIEVTAGLLLTFFKYCHLSSPFSSSVNTGDCCYWERDTEKKEGESEREGGGRKRLKMKEDRKEKAVYERSEFISVSLHVKTWRMLQCKAKYLAKVTLLKRLYKYIFITVWQTTERKIRSHHKYIQNMFYSAHVCIDRECACRSR